MVRAQIRKAVKGDTLAFAAIADRSDGKPAVVVSGDAYEPIAITVSRADDARARIEAALNRIAAQSVIEVASEEKDT